MFTSVLAAIDRVSVLDATVLTAARIAEQNNGKLHIIHVLESASRKNRRLIKHFKTGEEIVTGAEYEKAVTEEIKKVYDDILKSYGNYEIRVTPGFPWEEILRWSRQITTDLIVLGPHSTRAEEKGVVRVVGKIGSTVEGVIMRENCPVMIVNPSIQKQGLAFKRILVGIDFSRSCECALCFAVKLGQAYGSKLLSFHMIPVPPLPKYSKDDYEADRDAGEQRLREFCHKFLQGTDHEYSVRGGALPHLEILKYAEKKDADLIVMGSHTKEKTGKWYAGSVVERVSFRSRCAVVVVTDPEVLLPWEDSLTEKIHTKMDSDRSIRVFSKNRSRNMVEK
ncbi:MAG: universal stress protein [Deltaproteobacteria bacterium]|nr:MAG: universal stress protein [Deltaproteobacteria bacterium]